MKVYKKIICTCNNCPHFYNSYENNEDFWCDLSNKKILDFGVMSGSFAIDPLMTTGRYHDNKELCRVLSEKYGNGCGDAIPDWCELDDK